MREAVLIHFFTNGENFWRVEFLVVRVWRFCLRTFMSQPLTWSNRRRRNAGPGLECNLRTVSTEGGKFQNWNPMSTAIKITPATPVKTCFTVLFLWLAGISLPAQTAFIDSFAVGPQNFHIGPGDASASGSVSGLDSNQVVWGSRNFTIYADQNGCGFRSLDGGSISVSVNGDTPGSLTAVIDELASEGDSGYEPWIYLAYQSSGAAADWSGCDRIFITFSTPPTAGMRLQTYVGSGNSWYAETMVPAGAPFVTILFSDLIPTDTPFSGTNVLSCSFSFSPPMQELFAISSIQVIARPPSPLLNAACCPEGLQLTWPTNATGFALQHSMNLTEGFVTVTNKPVAAGTNFCVTLSCTGPAEFFRLASGP